jgi:hypothetical protein
MGAVVLEGERTAIVPARTGRSHLQALLHPVLLAAPDEHPGVSDLELGLRKLGGTMARRGLAVAVSDFIAPGAWERPLRGALVAKYVRFFRL